MHSVSDLTTFSRSTSGDVPPKLVGASTTVVGNNVYLYGGRLVTERRMVTDMWVFDLSALVWKKIEQASEDALPASRYFHSADSWEHYLVVFGGMGINPDAEEPADELLVLNDVRFFDLSTNRWMPTAWSANDLLSPPIAPNPRYAHLSSISGNRLFVIGGQDLHNVWLDDVYVYDLVRRGWVSSRDYPRHCGTYRSVAVAGSLRVRLPQHESRDDRATPKPVFHNGEAPPSASSMPPFTDSDSLVHLPYSAPSSDDFPTNIYLYSNYNFTDVKRELEVFTPRPGDGFDITDQSSAMVGTSFPPGLRFPSGAILGHHLIIAGTYLAHSFQSSSVWALNLHDMTWTRIDPGSTLSTGSWFRTALWAEANKFVIFGNRQGNLVDDYNRRLLSWDDIAIIDLEAFGIYQPPRLELDIRMQEIGLAALEEGVLADFEIVCDDDRRIRCSRRLLEERWPWFREQRKLFIRTAQRTLDGLPISPSQTPLPEVPGFESRPDPRLTPRYLSLSEPYPVTLALLQYLYSMALLTPLQHAPPVLSALLVISTNYAIPHLQALVKHAMHRALSNSTSVGVYEVATLCSCRSLQIRALKTVMLYNQKRPAGRSRQQDKDGSAGRPTENGGGADGSAGGAGGGGARPRGLSDAQLLSRQGGGAAAQGGRAVALSLTSDGIHALEDALQAEVDKLAAQIGNEHPTPVASRDCAPSPSRGSSIAWSDRSSSVLPSPDRGSSALRGRSSGASLSAFASPNGSSNGPPSTLLSFDRSASTSPNTTASPDRSNVVFPDRSSVASPPPFLGRKLRRVDRQDDSRMSVVSLNTHQDLTDFADMLLPIVDVSAPEPVAEALERESEPLDETLERTHRRASLTSLFSLFSLPTDGSSRLGVDAPRYAESISSSSASSSSPSPRVPPRSPGSSEGHHELSYLTHRDSDTPSLTSSASRSSFSSVHPPSLALLSPPGSPGPATPCFRPLDAADQLGFLGTIHEPAEYRAGSGRHPYADASAYGVDDAPEPDDSKSTLHSSDPPMTFAASPSPPTSPPPRARTQPRQKMPHVEALRLRTASPAETIMPPAPASVSAPAASSLGFAPPSPSPTGSKFSRLLSPSKGPGGGGFGFGALRAPSKASLLEEERAKEQNVRALKAEAKRLRKEEDRLRKERLMLEFRAKAEGDKRRGDARSVYSNKSEDTKGRKAAWEEQGAMYGGLGNFV